MSWQSLRDRFVDSPGSLSDRFRERRWQVFDAKFSDLGDLSVIDLGGRPETWLHLSVRPRRVCVVNLERSQQDTPAWLTVEHADACDLDERIVERGFDLVFSKAVLEHLGGHARRLAFAATVSRLARRHWIQTPYRYFPVEPHWLFPLFAQLPIAARVWITQRWPLVHTRPANREQALWDVFDVELVGRTEMHNYFPDSEIVDERVGPFVKSLIAVRS